MLSEAKIQQFKNAVLGRRFELSVVTLSRPKMQTLNKAYRKINKPTDILSFPLTKNSGEIFICLPEVKTHAKSFNMTYEQYLPYLVIHGMVHLQGLDHGRIMDRLEIRYCKALGVQHPQSFTKVSNGTTRRSRH